MSHLRTCQFAVTNESCHTYGFVLSHVWMCHITHMNESCHTYEQAELILCVEGLQGGVLQCVAVCCSVLQYVAVCCCVLLCVAVSYSVLQ